MIRTKLALMIAPALALALSACASLPQTAVAGSAAAPAPTPVSVRIVGINDFHGNLEPIRRAQRLVETDGSTHDVHAGGAAWLADAVAQTRAKAEYSLVIAAGDLISASPLVSSIFLDEPTIGAMNRIGLDFAAVGNHEFDRGWRELQRIQQGGCEKNTMRDPCAVEPFEGAKFTYLAANVTLDDGTTLFPAQALRQFGEGAETVSVGVIGLTLKDTPSLVTPSGVDGLAFGDEAEAINRAVASLKAQGADAVVVTIHQGLATEVGYDDPSCGGVQGPLIDILKRVDPRVDLVISGHTHRAYLCDFARLDPARPFLVTSAGYGGTLLTDIELTIDPVAGRVIAKHADNVVIQSTGTDSAGKPVAANPLYPQWQAVPEIAAYVARYADAAREASQRPVGRLSGAAADGGSDEETALGNLIADAQLFATRDAGAEIALMNNSGIRASLAPAPDGTVSYGDIYAVQPFGNTLDTKSFTGAQLLALLEQQFDADGFVQTFSFSEGFALTYDMRRPAGSRVVRASLNGMPIDPARNYRVTMNSFLAAGGDDFTLFREGTDAVTGPVDLDGFEAYLRTSEMRQLPATGRVTQIR